MEGLLLDLLPERVVSDRPLALPPTGQPQIHVLDQRLVEQRNSQQIEVLYLCSTTLLSTQEWGRNPDIGSTRASIHVTSWHEARRMISTRLQTI